MRHNILSKLGASQIVRTPNDIYKWEKNLEANPDSIHKINTDSTQFVKKSFQTTHKIHISINSYL